MCLNTVSCGKYQPRKDLLEISEYVSDNPEMAIEALDSIDYASLLEADRHYFDFLSIKASDKAYIIHESDSLILDVVDYYSSHDNDSIYTEALYYAGRVYSDLGESPKALSYFQLALDRLPESTKHINLRGNVLSQTGRLLEDLRLYDDAIPYIKDVLEIERSISDSINEVYDLHLLGYIYIFSNEYDKANQCLTEAIEKSRNMPLTFRLHSAMYMAALRYNEGNIPEALSLIRTIPDSINTLSNNMALAYSALIYKAAGVNDTAFNYAQKLIESSNPQNRQVGYQVIISPEIGGNLPTDSLDMYFAEYRSFLEDFLDENENALAINQQAFFNYSNYTKRYEREMVRNNTLTIIITTLSIIILLVAVVMLLRSNIGKNNIIRLQRKLLYLRKLSDSIFCDVEEGSQDNIQKIFDEETDINIIREKIKYEVSKRIQSNDITNWPSTPEEIANSEIYRIILNYIERGLIITDDNVWCELEQTVLKVSPLFKSILMLLSIDKMSVTEYHTALLIKCGFKPTEIAQVTGRTKGTIGSRRENLCKKVFKENLGTKTIDTLIQIL